MHIIIGSPSYTAAVMNMKRLGFVLVFGLLLLAAVFHAQVGGSLLAAGERCVMILVPSLYCYSIIAALAVWGGLIGSGRASVVAVVVLSQLGGYPLGAQLVTGMYRSGSITDAEAKKMLCVCIGCGPGFLLGTVCGRMPAAARLWMMLSVSLPQLFAALLLLRGICPAERSTQPLRGAKLLTGSVETAARAMLRICSMVMAMAGGMAILEGMGVVCLTASLHPAAPAFLRTLLEVSCITEWTAQGGSLPMAAALLSFGGICVHLQIASLSDGLLPWLQFWAVRILCSLAAYGLCWMGMPLVCRELQAVSLDVTSHIPHGTQGWLPGACLLLMSVLLLYRGNRVCGHIRQNQPE